MSIYIPTFASHVHPILYCSYDADGLIPTPFRSAYDRVDRGDYDIYNWYMSLENVFHSDKYHAALIGIEYDDGKYGILDTTIVENDTNLEFHTHRTETDTLRVFPNKELALKYMSKFLKLMTSHSNDLDKEIA